jgi:hypothetical protein
MSLRLRMALPGIRWRQAELAPAVAVVMTTKQHQQQHPMMMTMAS